MLYKYAFTTRNTLSFQALHSYTALPPIFPPLSEARSSQQVAADLAAAEVPQKYFPRFLVVTIRLTGRDQARTGAERRRRAAAAGTTYP